MDDQNKDTQNNQNELKIENTTPINSNSASSNEQGYEINKNLGSFSSYDPKKDVNNNFADDVIVSESSNKLGSMQESDKKINFEKFSKKKKSYFNFKIASNSFFVKIDSWLRNNRILLRIWLIIIGVILFILSFSITFPIVISIDMSNAGISSYFNFSGFRNIAISSNIMNYIALGFISIPLFYLFITVLVGINGVYRSRQFHFIFWICLAIAFLLMVISTCFGIYIVHSFNSFHVPV